MRGISKPRLLLISSSILLASCDQVTVPDAKKCTVAGIFQAGMNCSYTGHKQITQENAAALIKMLEDGAVITPHDDALREKTALNRLCYDAGAWCSYETKQYIANMVPEAAK